MEKEKEKVWDFIEKFVPNYSSRDDVALYNDLFKLYYNEFGIGDEANHLLEDSYQSDLSNPKIGRDLKQLEQSLYKEARENYLKEIKNKKMDKYKLQKFGVNYLNVTLAFEGSTEEEVQEMVHTFDFGEIVLVRGGKTLSLGTAEPKVEGFNIVLQIEEYEGALEEEIDVLGELDEASIRLGDRFEVEPDYITLFVNKGETTRAIELEVSLEDDNEAILDEVYYKGTKYYTRQIKTVKDSYTVGTTSLLSVLIEDWEQGEDSEEFISLSDILLFVPDDLIVATDRALLEYFLGELYERKL